MRAKTNFLFAIALCVAVVMGVESRAATVIWTAATGNFGEATNWDTGAVPVTGDAAHISNGIATVDSVHPLDLAGIRVNKNGTLVIEPGAEIGFAGFSFLGKSGDGTKTGTMNMNGGEVQSADTFIVGRDDEGILNMNGGLLSAANNFKIADKGSGVGTVNLNGGTIEAGGFSMGPGTALLDITDGIMEITGDLTGYIDPRVTAGLITGFGGSGVVSAVYDPTSDITTLSAIPVPEPTSIALLGLAGCLLAIGRRSK